MVDTGKALGVGLLLMFLPGFLGLGMVVGAIAGTAAGTFVFELFLIVGIPFAIVGGVLAFLK